MECEVTVKLIDSLDQPSARVSYVNGEVSEVLQDGWTRDGQPYLRTAARTIDQVLWHCHLVSEGEKIHESSETPFLSRLSQQQRETFGFELEEEMDRESIERQWANASASSSSFSLFPASVQALELNASHGESASRSATEAKSDEQIDLALADLVSACESAENRERGELARMVQQQYKLFQFVGASGLLLFHRGACVLHLSQEGQFVEATRGAPMGKTLEALVRDGEFDQQRVSRIFHLAGLKDLREEQVIAEEDLSYLGEDVESLAAVPFGSHGLVLLCNSNASGFDAEDGALILQVRDEMKANLLKKRNQEPEED